MSLLSIVQNVAASVNTDIPTTVVGNSNADARQWLALANSCIQEISRRHTWSALVLEHTFTTIAAVEQDSTSIPDDFDRFVADVALWNRTQNAPYFGPTFSNEWQTLQTSAVGGNVMGWWRYFSNVLGNEINIYPAPTAGETVAYEYVSSNLVTGGFSTFQVDTNTTFARATIEPLLEMNLTWRWLRAHGMDYAEEMATFERNFERAASSDQGLRVLVVESRHSGEYSWPGTVIP